MTVTLVGLTAFWLFSLPGDESVIRPRTPSMVHPADAAPLDVRAPRLFARGSRLAVRAPVLAVHGGKPPKPPKPQPEPRPITFPAHVRFDFTMMTPRRRQRVPRIADAIRQREPVVGLRIDGHADDRGLPLYNLGLSRRRSCRVARELRRLLSPEIPPMQIRAFGEAHPVAPNIQPDGTDAPGGRAANRRVEVIILSHEPSRRLACRRDPNAS